MTKEGFVKAGGVGLMVSGLALGYSYISHPHQMTPEVIASGFWIVIHLLFAASILLGLLATTAIYAPFALATGYTGVIGYLFVFFGMSLIFGLDYYEFLIAPYLALHYPKVIIDHGAGDAMGWVALVFPLSGSLTVTGFALLGWVWMKSGVIPRLVALVLIISALAFGMGLSPIGGILAAQVTAALFGLALISTGFSAFRHPVHIA